MQTIGERLEEARKKKGISIREAAEATKIRGDYLQKFESNHFDIGLTEIYTRGFLRTYANFLKLPGDRILSDYAALGRGDTRPRAPSREVYGRMDISVASAAEAADRAASPGESSVSSDTSPPQPRFPRGGSSLPSGPDPALLFKYGKWAGAVVLLILLILIGKSFFSGRDSNPVQAGNTPSPGPQAAAERTITLVALDAVTVTVLRRNADESEGEELFKATLSRGQTRTVPWPGPIYIRANLGENLEIEYKGKRYPTKFVGDNRAKM
ncbi:MAG TPA: helix-turn-helix domain-containing protein [Opitutaceae bacterium]|nr:helix-turn-helix domain-containing protein [Opitutaceae bacterium]